MDLKMDKTVITFAFKRRHIYTITMYVPGYSYFHLETAFHSIVVSCRSIDKIRY